VAVEAAVAVVQAVVAADKREMLLLKMKISQGVLKHPLLIKNRRR
jgi:hypothetical protein